MYNNHYRVLIYICGLIVAGEGFLSRQVSRVEFIPTTAKPQPTMPPDISRDEFQDMNDVLTTCMPRSQLGTVISSYEKTIGTQKHHIDIFVDEVMHDQNTKLLYFAQILVHVYVQLYFRNFYCAFNINQLVLCVAMLLAKNQRSQAAQAMHELGNLQYHASNIR